MTLLTAPKRARPKPPETALPGKPKTHAQWLSGVRGSALLWVARGRQAGIRPLVVSHGSGCGFLSDFIWTGGNGGLRGSLGRVSLALALAV